MNVQSTLWSARRSVGPHAIFAILYFCFYLLSVLALRQSSYCCRSLAPWITLIVQKLIVHILCLTVGLSDSTVSGTAEPAKHHLAWRAA